MAFEVDQEQEKQPVTQVETSTADPDHPSKKTSSVKQSENEGNPVMDQAAPNATEDAMQINKEDTEQSING